ncbi:ComEC/Rec2 family competence protein [Paenibacillus turpanensis]|uniref:ComEC/Rec2 family competence protein n=1 Tax=Paenibacillus turpanensis TaxID=2689078 RepID=UPI001407C59E|nr:MBL fold metallo-hydrolase [Paenibacillus turpanensis]
MSGFVKKGQTISGNEHKVKESQGLSKKSGFSRLWALKRLKTLFPAVLILALFLVSACTQEQSAATTKTSQQPAFFNTSLHQGKLAIRYFDLQAEEKSGDAILLTAPDGKTMLIDAGIPVGGPQLEERLNKLGVKKLDAVVSTHPHIDHIGGLTTLLITKPVGAYYHNGIAHNTETYRKVQQLLKEKSIPQTMLREGDHVEWSPGITIEVLNPSAEISQNSFEKWGTEELNNHGLVLLVTHGDNRILFTGDIYKNQEYKLVERYGDKLRAKLMDAPHHGDITSSSGTFIRAVQPEIAVLSANVLQSLDVLKRYEKEGATVYNTGLNGNILFVSDGATISSYPDKERKMITRP